MQAYVPFTECHYKDCRGYELPWIELIGFSYYGVDCRVWIQHQIDNASGTDVWKLGFDRAVQEQITNNKLLDILEPLGLSGYSRELSTTEELFEVLDELCKDLSVL